MSKSSKSGPTTTLRIDKDDLDNELVEQAQRFFNVAEEHSLAISRRDALYATKKEVQARRREEIRDEWEEKGKKVTEKALDAAVPGDPEYQQAVADLGQAEEEVRLLEARRGAWRMRSHALHDLCQLHLSSHYLNTDDSGPGDRSGPRRRPRVRK